MGNPLTDETATFKWLMVILAGAGSVALASVLFGSIFAIWYGLVLIFILIILIAKGMIYMMGSPDEDESESDITESESTSVDAAQPPESLEADSDFEDSPPGR